MKKIIACILMILLILTLSAGPLAASGGSVTISLKASASQVRLGNTITVTGNVNASAVLATFDLNVTYDAGQLQYVKTEGLTPAIKSGELDVNPSSGKVQLLYLDSDGGGSGITSGNAFRVTFKVIGGNVGEKINVGIQIKTAGDANAAAMSTSGSGTSMLLAAPLSTNASLKSLTVDYGTLSPAFAKSTTSYSLSVPYEVNKIKISAAAEDDDAKVVVDSPDLAAGGKTTITVTVTAPSGTKKTYTVSVSRAQDPNYIPSSNNELASLTVDGFLLSPGFNQARLEYILYLPYEIDQVTVAAAPEDSKASVAIEGNTALQAGQANLVTISCTAEDQSIKTYKIVAMRANEFTSISEISQPSPSPAPTVSPTPALTPVPSPTNASPTPQATPTETTASQAADPLASPNGEVPLNSILPIALGAAVLIEGGLIVFLLRRRQ